MPTYYLDPEGGNDANDGTTFANRWRTLTTGGTLARLGSGGGDIRVMASRDPHSIGTATFTNDKDSFVLSSAKTLTISGCDSLWTQSANITHTLTANRVAGEYALTFAPATAFTTGKVAYLTLGGPLDLSGYEAFSLMVTPGGTLAGTWTISLCTDTIGATPVHTATIGATNGRWRAVYFDNGTTPLSSNINSIAINCTVDPGTVSLTIDNIVACRHKDHADHICHNCVVGKNTVGEPEWYPVLALDGTRVRTRGMTNGLGSVALTTHAGATETTTCMAMHPTPATVASEWVLQAGGDLDGVPINISGGWDRTAMTSQSGETWFSGQRLSATGMNLNDKNGVRMEKMGFVAYATNALVYGTTATISKNHILNMIGVVDIGSNAFSAGSAGTGRTSLTCGFTNVVGGNVVSQVLMNCISYHEYNFSRVMNVQSTTAGAIGGGLGGVSKRIAVDKILNCEAAVEIAVGGGKVYIANTQFDKVQKVLVGTVSTGEQAFMETFFDNCEIMQTAHADLFNTNTGGEIPDFHWTNANGDPDNWGSYSEVTRVIPSPKSRGGATKCIHTTNAQFRLRFNTPDGMYTPNGIIRFGGYPLCKVAVKKNKLVTVRAKVKSEAMNNFVYLMVRGIDAFPGVGYKTSDTMVTNPLQWNEIELTFTPTANGVVQIWYLADWENSYLLGSANGSDFRIDEVTYTVAP